MNIASVAANLNLRRIDLPKPLPAKSGPAPQSQTPALQTLSTSAFTRSKIGDTHSAASGELRDAVEKTAVEDESALEQAREWSDDAGDLLNDREPLDEREHGTEKCDEEEQRHRQEQRLGALENQCRAQLLMLDGVMKNLKFADQALIAWMEGTVLEPAAASFVTFLN